MRVMNLTMTFLVVLRSTAAFHASAARRSSTTTTRLSASFLEDLTKSFSSMSSGGTQSSSKYFTIGITGASGLIGTALQDELSQRDSINGKPIRTVRLTRGSKAEQKGKLEDQPSTSLVWNPKATSPDEIVDPEALKEMDAVIHLSGENISTGLSGPLAPLGIRPWTDAKKKEIIDSRVITTTALSKAIANNNSNNKKNFSFLVASGVGAYGPNFVGQGVPAVDESADIAKSEGFLAEVSRQWEGCTEEAKKKSRVVNLRNGVVLSTNGGALAKLYPVFFLGGGGIVGSGQQYFPYISARDMARAMIHVLETPSLQGPVNMCAPEGGCTNAEFTQAMGKVLRRPTFLPLPAFAVSLLFGEMGEEVLLGGTRAQPKKLLDSGFTFLHPTVEEAVQSAVDEKNI